MFIRITIAINWGFLWSSLLWQYVISSFIFFYEFQEILIKLFLFQFLFGLHALKNDFLPLCVLFILFQLLQLRKLLLFRLSWLLYIQNLRFSKNFNCLFHMISSTLFIILLNPHMNSWVIIKIKL